MSEIMNPNPRQEPADIPEERLDDEKRIKVLSPSMMVFKRFIRNQLAIVGLVILVLMFVFSFIGGLLMPYKQQQVFRKYEKIPKEYASATVNRDLRYVIAAGERFPNAAIAKFVLALNNGRTLFESGDMQYSFTEEGADFYQLYEHKTRADLIILAGSGQFTPAEGEELSDVFKEDAIAAASARQTEFDSEGVHYFVSRIGKSNRISYTKPIGVASKFIFDAFDSDARQLLSNPAFIFQAEQAINSQAEQFEYDGVQYHTEISENAVLIHKLTADGEKPFAAISNLIVRAISPDIFLTIDFKQAFNDAITEKQNAFTVTDSAGEPVEYTIRKVHETYTIYAQTTSQLLDSYAFPTREHLLGTDANGMDVMTRLMYGGRISLMVGFVVVFLEILIGVIIGGISGYFGGTIDIILMRFVDLFNSIPFWPVVIITGAVMDKLEVQPIRRIFLLMAILGILGWTGIARVVRGQILSLREQDFMVATEAAGIPISRRIFRHLVPNVMPLLIVQATLGLGSIIITEATLSFLGLGVKYPYASWGSIINAATNLHVMTNYWFIWIPAGVLILLTVLGFNFVGDGLRDAFDPKMKR